MGLQHCTTSYDPQRREKRDPDANEEAPGREHKRRSKEHPTRVETPIGSADFIKWKHQIWCLRARNRCDGYGF